MSAIQQQNLKSRSDVHLSRKIWHCVGISLIAVFYNYWGAKVSWIVAIAVAVTFIPLDIMRQSSARLNKVAVKLFGPLMRKHEYHSLSGMTYLFLACLLLLALNRPPVVTLTLLFLAFGDPVASYFGLRFGRDRILGRKTLQGTLAAFVVCTIIAALYYYFNNLMIERLLIVAPLSGLIGALAELIPIGRIDDNFTFPVVSALLLCVLFKVYGGFGL